MADPAKISVVIPVYNEVRTIGEVINRVLNCGFDTEVIVVDDASTDGTREFLQNFHHGSVKVFYHSQNRGKGAALRMGFAAASNPYVFVQDADLEYDPSDYHAMIKPLLDGRADMVYGSRFLGGPHRVLLYWAIPGPRLRRRACHAGPGLGGVGGGARAGHLQRPGVDEAGRSRGQ